MFRPNFFDSLHPSQKKDSKPPRRKRERWAINSYGTPSSLFLLKTFKLADLNKLLCSVLHSVPHLVSPFPPAAKEEFRNSNK